VRESVGRFFPSYQEVIRGDMRNLADVTEAKGVGGLAVQGPLECWARVGSI
jgi:hypothetical protein